jgi:hypothetical protein
MHGVNGRCVTENLGDAALRNTYPYHFVDGARAHPGHPVAPRGAASNHGLTLGCVKFMMLSTSSSVVSNHSVPGACRFQPRASNIL